jgi:hypothetical protein
MLFPFCAATSAREARAARALVASTKTNCLDPLQRCRQRARKFLFSLGRIVKAMLEQKRLNQAVDAAMLNDAFLISYDVGALTVRLSC